MKKRFKFLVFLLVVSILLVACSKGEKTKGSETKATQKTENSSTTASETSTTTSESTSTVRETVTEEKPDENLISDKTITLISDYYKSEYKFFDMIYDIGEEVKKVNDNEVKIDSLTKLQEFVLGDETYGIFNLMTSVAYNGEWLEESHLLLANSLDNGETWEEVLGELNKPRHMDENYTFTDEDILEVKNSLVDINASLRLKGYSGLIGTTSSPDFLLEEAVTEVMEDYEPIYEYGDYWVYYHYPQMDVLAYYSYSRDKASIFRVDTSREDISTYDGIKIGSSRDDVLETYSKFEKYIVLEGTENILHYCEDEEGYGINIIFELKEGKVSKISMYNQFD